MNIDKDTLKKVAHLARVEVPENKEEELVKDLQKILTWVEKLKELDTSYVEPLTNMSFEKDAVRKDEVSHPITKEQALKNAPKHDGTFFKVPKVLDK